MHDRSLLLRILSLLKMRRIKVEVLYLSNHKPDPRNKLTTYSFTADREAKLSLNSHTVSVPDVKTHLDDTVLYVCTDDPNEVNCLTAQENNPMRFFQTINQETRQIYLCHGKWHNYLLHFSIWQDASFFILHLKRGKQCHRMRARLSKNARIYAHVSPCGKCVKNCVKNPEKFRKMPKKSEKKKKKKTYEIQSRTMP
jgi:hypothetical protein